MSKMQDGLRRLELVKVIEFLRKENKSTNSKSEYDEECTDRVIQMLEAELEDLM